MDNYSSLEPWTFPPAFTESCGFPDAFTHETEALTRALQISLSTDADHASVLAAIAAAGSSFHRVNHDLSASASEMMPRQTRTPALSPLAGKVSKRKPRASKRSSTTYVVANPSNFRHMVQQATGVSLGGARTAAEAVLTPEPQLMAMEGSCLPTLDTSAFWLERDLATAAGSPAAPSSGSQSSFGSVAEGSGFDIDMPFFPTLESWGIM